MCHEVRNSISSNGFKNLIRLAFFSVNTTHKIKILRRLISRKLPEATPGTIIFFYLVFIKSFISFQVISLKTQKIKNTQLRE
jgi:hypothetical protein